MVLFHILGVAALFFFSWKGLIAAVVLYVVAINVGIGMGYHRLLTHRGYKVSRWLEYVIAVCGTLSLEGGPIFWVATHRVHHQLSDHDGGPRHTPREGTFWAHMGWIMSGESLHAETAMLARYAPDLGRDRFYLWLSKYHWVPLTTVGLLLLAWGRVVRGSVGHLPARDPRPACYVAGQLRDTPLGLAPLSDPRRLTQ